MVVLVVESPSASAGDIRDMIQSLNLEDHPEEGMTTHSSILIWRIPMDSGVWWARVHGVTKSQTGLSNSAHGTSLVVQLLRICFAMQGMRA